MSQIYGADISYYAPLCQYYNVTIETAIELGARSEGRRPSLPSSPTCKPVTGLTFEDIWALKPRKTEKEIFEFYADQGAWSSFRQMSRHRYLTQFHHRVLSDIMKQNMHLCEYGCGIAPFSSSLLHVLDRSTSMKLSISDVECEHFNFGAWRLNELIKQKSLNVELFLKNVLPDKLPSYDHGLDAVILFEVLEHVPSPIKTIENLMNHMNKGCLLIENFIKHAHNDDDDGPDLSTAALERNAYYDVLSSKMVLLKGVNHIDGPNETRLWKML